MLETQISLHLLKHNCKVTVSKEEGEKLPKPYHIITETVKINFQCQRCLMAYLFSPSVIMWWLTAGVPAPTRTGNTT